MKYLVVAAMLLGSAVAWSPPTQADTTCQAAATLTAANNTCETTFEDLGETIATAPTGTIYKTQIKCTTDGDSGVCYNPLQCPAPPGALRYDVLRSTDGGATFTKVSEVCLTNPPPPPTPVITIALITQQFKAIDWGESPLIVQPPGGRTLVNLATNFYTTNIGPRVQALTLLGQQVDIEATPASWTWHHGDDTTQTTATPGAPYPDLAVTHTYLDTGAALAPSVDTTYAGRYRVNGGDWTAIPDTVTINGTPGQLDVVSATPQLVASE